ncbi:Biotin transport ATP-binding protein BioM [Tritonibacter multivorans]|uniref:Biotin transport ATP-binding protein BioM n=1 Tax=Tritonibacter multivorans TaxID=928856 RepID=A0A0N7LZU4_9RHOB|nr:ABC transporter ATP-binding protein [Tritonibacter multivorans]MDA7422027.1 ABC transporter ATP-binding protein [Tritonibacter multivorans]CUH78633.1 Biotin transport ATP-binding protein BioM [Tritonibacter multivorans]SFD66928.1 biotin transport system ATP-binding protein [Tritonibacter multivorans]
MATVSQIEIKDLAFAIEGKEILHGLTLSLAERRVGIVGRNGSGKSTFARVVSGLVAPTSGSVTVNGHDLAKDRRAAIREVGILFQNPEHQIIFPTVGEEIAFGLEQQGLSKADAAQETQAVLDQFGLSHWKEAHIATLSQGQKHLVCLMAISAMKPKLLVLDEPFAGLDIPTKAQMNRYLSLYEGSLLHITHDPADLEGYDHVVWIDQGTLRQAGSRPEVMNAYLAAMHSLGEDDDIAYLSR